MTKTEQFNTRLDPDDAAAVNEYADEHGVTKSEATRRLIRAGIDSIDEDGAGADVQPFASQRVRFVLFALQTTLVIAIAAGTGEALSSYLAAAVAGLVGSTLLDRVLEWLRYPSDSPIPWREGQGE
jgi:hypothetical protein